MYCESTVICCDQFSWFLQNTLTPGFLNLWFQTVHIGTMNGKVVFRRILNQRNLEPHNSTVFS